MATAATILCAGKRPSRCISQTVSQAAAGLAAKSRMRPGSTNPPTGASSRMMTTPDARNSMPTPMASAVRDGERSDMAEIPVATATTLAPHL